MVEATKKLNIPSAVAVLIIIDAPRLARTKKAAKKAFLLFEIFFVNQNVTNAQSNPKITLGNLKENSEKPKVFKLMTCSQWVRTGLSSLLSPANSTFVKLPESIIVKVAEANAPSSSSTNG